MKIPSTLTTDEQLKSLLKDWLQYDADAENNILYSLIPDNAWVLTKTDVLIALLADPKCYLGLKSIVANKMGDQSLTLWDVFLKNVPTYHWEKCWYTHGHVVALTYELPNAHISIEQWYSLAKYTEQNATTSYPRESGWKDLLLPTSLQALLTLIQRIAPEQGHWHAVCADLLIPWDDLEPYCSQWTHLQRAQYGWGIIERHNQYNYPESSLTYWVRPTLDTIAKNWVQPLASECLPPLQSLLSINNGNLYETITQLMTFKNDVASDQLIDQVDTSTLFSFTDNLAFERNIKH